MGFDLKVTKSEEIKDGKWFNYDDDGDVSFKVRYISPDYAKKLRVKHTKSKWKKGKMEDKLNEDAFSNDLADYVIADWKGIMLNGEPAECNFENKELLLDNSTDHAKFIYEIANDIMQFEDKTTEEDLRKNSESG